IPSPVLNGYQCIAGRPPCPVAESAHMGIPRHLGLLGPLLAGCACVVLLIAVAAVLIVDVLAWH
ncbi:hypothetical protein WDZ92_51425, partial [Nostoc sp. NIES-2111]